MWTGSALDFYSVQLFFATDSSWIVLTLDSGTPKENALFVHLFIHNVIKIGHNFSCTL